MQKLYVWAEHIEGFVLAGILSFKANGDERFRYAPSYLERSDAQPLYAVFPLQEEGFDRCRFGTQHGANIYNERAQRHATKGMSWTSTT